MKYQQQVDKNHYHGTAYSLLERWDSYWHQINLVHSCSPKSVLEVGVGGGVVARELAASGVTVKTLDIAEDLHPDLVGSITDIPAPDNSFDVSLAAEVLEHIQFEDVERALCELARVARTHVVISIPRPGYIFWLGLKLPLVKRLDFFFKLPFFWKDHAFNGQHYWELDKRGYPMKAFLTLATKAGLTLATMETYSDDPAHQFFVFSK